MAKFTVIGIPKAIIGVPGAIISGYKSITSQPDFEKIPIVANVKTLPSLTEQIDTYNKEYTALGSNIASRKKTWGFLPFGMTDEEKAETKAEIYDLYLDSALITTELSNKATKTQAETKQLADIQTRMKELTTLYSDYGDVRELSLVSEALKQQQDYVPSTPTSEAPQGSYDIGDGYVILTPNPTSGGAYGNKYNYDGTISSGNLPKEVVDSLIAGKSQVGVNQVPSFYDVHKQNVENQLATLNELGKEAGAWESGGFLGLGWKDPKTGEVVYRRSVMEERQNNARNDIQSVLTIMKVAPISFYGPEGTRKYFESAAVVRDWGGDTNNIVEIKSGNFAGKYYMDGGVIRQVDSGWLKRDNVITGEREAAAMKALKDAATKKLEGIVNPVAISSSFKSVDRNTYNYEIKAGAESLKYTIKLDDNGNVIDVFDEYNRPVDVGVRAAIAEEYVVRQQAGTRGEAVKSEAAKKELLERIGTKELLKRKQELIDDKMMDDMAYDLTYKLLNELLGKWAYETISEWCSADFEASDAEFDTPQQTGGGSSGGGGVGGGNKTGNKTGGAGGGSSGGGGVGGGTCTGSQTTVTAQLSQSGTGPYNYQYSFTITACKQALTYRVYLINGGEVTLEEGNVELGKTRQDTDQKSDNIDFAQICVQVSDTEINTACFAKA